MPTPADNRYRRFKFPTQFLLVALVGAFAVLTLSSCGGRLFLSRRDSGTQHTAYTSHIQSYVGAYSGYPAGSGFGYDNGQGYYDGDLTQGTDFSRPPSEAAMQAITTTARNYSAPRATPAYAPNHIALLLPLHGRLGSSGKSIRNGFLSAYYQAKQHDSLVPKITIIDTSKHGVLAAHRQAVQQGADFIVGPLSKHNVSILADNADQSGEFSIPTLVLNTLGRADAARAPRNWVQFALSPLDEAYQVAERARADNRWRAAIIAPDDAWGQSIARSFAIRWQSLGAQLLVNLAYSNPKRLGTDIKTLLNVNQSESRASQLHKTLREKLRFKPRRRQDIDMIFLVALPRQARQIRPLIKFYYGGSIPVYAISSVYTGVQSPRNDRDLNGVQFCDIPWVLTDLDKMSPQFRDIYQRIVTSWPKHYRRHPKLYAMGIDAYRLVYGVGPMQRNSRVTMHGATGDLYLVNHRIHRLLTWARFDERGHPVLIPIK